MLRHKDVPPNSMTQVIEFVSKTKPRFVLRKRKIPGWNFSEKENAD